ncbi:MAG TPA: hypothetical protein DDY14_10130 [Chromatiaceae bacterium]|nr:hypothetical protein [Chromatiaceae bacterium]
MKPSTTSSPTSNRSDDSKTTGSEQTKPDDLPILGSDPISGPQLDIQVPHRGTHGGMSMHSATTANRA